MLSVLTLYAIICLHKNIKQDMVLYMTQYAMPVITFNYSNSYEEIELLNREERLI